MAFGGAAESCEVYAWAWVGRGRKLFIENNPRSIMLETLLFSVHWLISTISGYIGCLPATMHHVHAAFPFSPVIISFSSQLNFIHQLVGHSVLR